MARNNGREGYSDEYPVDFSAVDFPQPNAKFGAQLPEGMGYMMPFVNPFFYNNGMDEAMLKEYIKKQMWVLFQPSRFYMAYFNDEIPLLSPS